MQLHGSENNEYITELKSLLPENCEIWQAQAVVNEVQTLNKNVEHHVLDGKAAGSGQPFDWRMLARSEQDLSCCFLAGGLSSNNIDHAIEQLTKRPLFGLDLNSGVEASPGIKCSNKLNQVFAQIRHY